jgi:hypothetical protein
MPKSPFSSPRLARPQWRAASLISLLFAFIGACADKADADGNADDGSDDKAAEGAPNPSSPMEGDAATPSSPSNTALPATPGTTPFSPTGDPLPVDESAPLVGRFSVLLQAANGATPAVARFTGNVADGPTLELTLWDQADEDTTSGCVLLIPRQPNCTTPCDTDSACVGDQTCALYPSKHSVGNVKVTGLSTLDGDSEFTIAPQKPRFDYQKPASIDLSYPPASEGALVTLKSEGGDYSPLEITTTAIAPLELTSPSPLELSGDAPLELTWVAPSAGESRVAVKVDVSHHGGAKGKIECDAADSGSLVIPAELTKALIELGVAGFPTVEITRFSLGIGNVEPGRVEFTVSSPLTVDLSLPGLVSCNTNEDCPSDQTCLQQTHACG